MQPQFIALLSLLASSPTWAQPEPTGSVILFIGDGLGATQISLGLYHGRLGGRDLHIERLMKEGYTGYALALPYESTVIDSAAAASQIATGEKARNETLGLSSDGYPLETILEWAERGGLATGLVTNMRLTHATPAAFASHRISRYDPEAAIADEVLAGHDIEVLLGGGGRALVPTEQRASEHVSGITAELDGSSNRGDTRNLIEEARTRGYRVVSRRDELDRESREAGKLLGVFAAEHLPYVVDRVHLGLEQVPSLAEMTRAALTVLARSPTGFFVMVEAGRVDYAGHDNDAGTMLHEILELDGAVGAALEFQRGRPDTLVIVTADHGTGGFSFTYSDGERRESVELASGLRYGSDHYYPAREELETLYRQKASYKYILDNAGSSPERLVEAVKEFTGLELTLAEAVSVLARDENGLAWTVDFPHFYGDVESNPACLLARALSRQTHVAWSTGGHTMEPVLTFGTGPGAGELRGVYPTTHIHGVMKRVLERHRD